MRLSRSIVVVTGLTVLAAGGLAALGKVSGPREQPLFVMPDPPGISVPAERVTTGPLLDRSGAWLTLGDAASRVRVRFARLPGLLYRVSTAPDAGVAAVVSRRGGRVTVRLRATDGAGLDEVRIVLNRAVRWDIRLPAGAGEQQINLKDGRVRRISLGSAGLSRVWLPEPDGTVPVVFTGGVGTAVLSARNGAPFRIRFDAGAGSVETPWTANNGTAAGTVLREPAFPDSRDRYRVRAQGGVGALVIHRGKGRIRPGGRE
ncbi:MAG TPA: hypothetical protein VN408_06940 [Actinoplanes sp.]|nr:hypothetical protein [Actinoplanes sp.]